MDCSVILKRFSLINSSHSTDEIHWSISPSYSLINLAYQTSILFDKEKRILISTYSRLSKTSKREREREKISFSCYPIMTPFRRQRQILSLVRMRTTRIVDLMQLINWNYIISYMRFFFFLSHCDTQTHIEMKISLQSSREINWSEPFVFIFDSLLS